MQRIDLLFIHATIAAVICFSTSATAAFQSISISSFAGRQDALTLRPTQSACGMLPMNHLLTEFSLMASNEMDKSNLYSATATAIASTEQSIAPPPIEGLSPTANVIIFIIGLIPFIWATYEFWSRIAVGASFGTGADSIQIRPSGTTIGSDGDPLKSRGQQVLGDDALAVAYFLFAVAIASVSIAVYSVVSSPPM